MNLQIPSPVDRGARERVVSANPYDVESGVFWRRPMQQRREGPRRRGQNRSRARFDVRSPHDAGQRFDVFRSEGRVDCGNHVRFTRRFERGRRRLARGGETGGSARDFQLVRVRHREAKRQDER
jgi:hypothetical protein